MNNILIKIAFLFQEKEAPLIFEIIVITLTLITALLVVFIIVRGLFIFFEMAFVEYFKKKQFFTHFYFKRNKLSKENRLILKQDFSFYNEVYTIAGTKYINPIADNALRQYNYKILDTIDNGHGQSILIHYKPTKKKAFLGIEGVLYIDTKSFAWYC